MTTNSFVLDDAGFGGRIHLTGSGEYLLAGQDASSLYAGDLLTHFDFVTALLPNGWTGVAHEVQTYEVLDRAYAGTTDINTLTFYTFDAPPEPPPVPLGAPWQTGGTVAISADGSNITLLGVAGAGGDAVAILAAGAMAEVGNFVLEARRLPRQARRSGGKLGLPASTQRVMTRVRRFQA